MKRREIVGCVVKGITWYAGNLIFGCVPIIFMGMVFFASRGKLGFNEMQQQIHEGALLFVCVAMMGGIMLDLLQSETRFSPRQIVVMIFVPISAIAVLLVEYLFVMLKIIDTDCFDINSLTSAVMLTMSLVYCITFKIQLLIKEDFKL